MEKAQVIRYYEWGSEKPGHVSTWTKDEKGNVKHLGEMRRDQLPENAVFDCPFS